MIEPRRFHNRPVELSVGVEGGHSTTRNVCLDPNVEGTPHPRVVGLQLPSVRTDGWLEIEMGEFFNSG
ncbi:F-box protein PP2-B1, partial [Trifolium medium]|nr:F-box protein PP2-B1 [Trifolium medium]